MPGPGLPNGGPSETVFPEEIITDCDCGQDNAPHISCLPVMQNRNLQRQTLSCLKSQTSKKKKNDRSHLLTHSQTLENTSLNRHGKWRPQVLVCTPFLPRRTPSGPGARDEGCGQGLGPSAQATPLTSPKSKTEALPWSWSATLHQNWLPARGPQLRKAARSRRALQLQRECCLHRIRRGGPAPQTRPRTREPHKALQVQLPYQGRML